MEEVHLSLRSSGLNLWPAPALVACPSPSLYKGSKPPLTTRHTAALKRRERGRACLKVSVDRLKGTLQQTLGILVPHELKLGP